MSNRPRHSLGKRLFPALVITGSAAGLISLLDHPSTGSAGLGLGGGPLLGGGDANGAPAVDTTPTQPPAVSSTLPLPGNDDGAGEDAGEDGSGEEDDGGGPVGNIPTPTHPGTTVPAQPKPAATGPCTGKTVDGPAVMTRWGTVQVEAVMSADGRICDVGAIRSPGGHTRSIRINEQALPILHDEVMKAQSARIAGVSGATVTSEGYVESLQAILDGKTG
jgi:uncharacterized protein with FMN-binding domain